MLLLRNEHLHEVIEGRALVRAMASLYAITGTSTWLADRYEVEESQHQTIHTIEFEFTQRQYRLAMLQVLLYEIEETAQSEIRHLGFVDRILVVPICDRNIARCGRCRASLWL